MTVQTIPPGSTAAALIERHVVVDSSYGPAEARLADYGIPVWSLIGYQPAAAGDLGNIADAYQISLDAVLAAFAFYATHRSEIDARLEMNAGGE